MRNGELGGCLISTRLSPSSADLHLLFKKTFWGRATTLAALRMVCEEVFATGVQTIESSAPTDSRALLALTKAVGVKHAGVVTGCALRNGKPVDMIALVLERNAFFAKTGAN